MAPGFLQTATAILAGLNPLHLFHWPASTPPPIQLHASGPEIQTTSGLLQGGYISPATNAYLGVPYAVPPVGSLRFMAPRELNTPEIKRSATRFGKACVRGRGPMYAYQESRSGEGEDCLTLNIWAPTESKEEEGRPVFVWVPGGGFSQGATSLPLYDMTHLSQRHPDIIFISLNYRLTALGYPSTPALTPPNTNAGLRDIRLALRWIQENIAAFGGNPNHIVLGGQSAGAAAVSGYLFSNASREDNFLAGAVTMSGTALLMSEGLGGPGTPSDAPGGKPSLNMKESFQVFAEECGCKLNEDKDYSEQLRCLQSITDENVFVKAFKKKGKEAENLTPAVDEDTVFALEEYRVRGREGNFAKIPLLTGTTNNEGDAFFLYSERFRILNYNASDFATRTVFTCPDRDIARYTYSQDVPVYRYRYMPSFPSVSVPPERAKHNSDLFTLFGNFNTTLSPSAPRPPPPDENALEASKYMMDSWAAFIRDPKDGLKSFGWERYEKGHERLVELFENEIVDPNPISVVDARTFEGCCFDWEI